MKFTSTRDRALRVPLETVVLKGLADDGGLFLPEQLPGLDPAVLAAFPGMDFPAIAAAVADRLLGEDLPAAEWEAITRAAFDFDAPLVELEPGLHVLELFHGPTLAFKDFGARFAARLVAHFVRRESRDLTILVATSGDTGSAVASAFHNLPGIRVVILFPAGRVSPLQEKLLTVMGGNVAALEVAGSFDDCQALVKRAFVDPSLSGLRLSSANSINFARLFPQSFYYFYAHSRLQDQSRPSRRLQDLAAHPACAVRRTVFSVPSGNFGNLTAGLIAKRMGLPVDRFVAATNANDVVPKLFRTGRFQAEPSKATLSNAMDVGDPSNLARILDLYDGDLGRMRREIVSTSHDDAETLAAIAAVRERYGYTLDPHGAVGYCALRDYFTSNGIRPGDVDAVILATAHPVKFRETVEPIAGPLAIPARLDALLARKGESVKLAADYATFRNFLRGLG